MSTSGKGRSVELRDAPVESETERPEAGAVMARTDALRTYLAIVGSSPLAIALALSAVFAPAVLIPYAFSDDYAILWLAIGGGPSVQFGKNVFEAGAITGRPFAGLITQGAFSAAGTIENLRWVRLLTVVGIIALALLLHWALVRSGLGPAVAALIAVFICTMPPFQVWASWTVLVSTPFAALAAAGASRVAVAAVEGPRSLLTDRLVGAGGLLVASLLTYQPAAMFFWVFLAVALIGAAQEPRRATRLVGVHFGLAAAALAITFVVIKVSVHLIGEHSQGAARNALVKDYGDKIDWFLRVPLYQALNLFKLVPSTSLALAVAAVAAGGTSLLILQRCARPALYFAVGLALIPLTFLPNLVVAENTPNYRVQVALTSLMALYTSLGVIGIWINVRDWLKPRLSASTLIAVRRSAYGCAVTAVGVTAFLAAQNVLTLFADPQVTELRLLRSQVARLPANPPRVAFVQTGYTQGLTKLALLGEFGVPTTVQIFNLEPSLYLLLHEQGRLPMDAPRPQVDLYSPDATTFPEGEPVIDLRGMQDLR